ASGATVAALESFRLRNGRAQTDGEIVSEVIAANRNGDAMANHAPAKDEQFRSAATDVQEAAAEIAFVLGKTGFRGSQRFENGIGDEDAGFVRGRNEILRSGDRGSHEMDVDFQALTDHADGVTYAVLRIHDEFMRKNMKDFAVFRKSDVTRGVDGAA